MINKLSTPIKPKAFYHLRRRDFDPIKVTHYLWLTRKHFLKQKASSHHLNKYGVRHSQGNNPVQLQSVKKRTWKTLLVEFIFIPISIACTAGLHGIMYLLNYYHIEVLVVHFHHFITYLLSWFPTSIFANSIRRFVALIRKILP